MRSLRHFLIYVLFKFNRIKNNIVSRPPGKRASLLPDGPGFDSDTQRLLIFHVLLSNTNTAYI